MARVTIVGAGLVGRAWAISFARGGHAVSIWDGEAAAPGAARSFVAGVLPELAANDLLGGQSPQDVLERIGTAGSLEAALDAADHVQECVPERLEVKQAIFATLDSAAPTDAVLASSSSAILPSRFTEPLAGRHRCLVAHPINPPYLVPAVEIVPAPWTAPEAVARTRALLVSCGQAPIVMAREIDGFLMNRLQGALLEEAFRLVASGHASVEDVDIGLREGLALRWSFMGPFETIDLNAPGGVRDYAVRYEGIYARLFPQMQHRVEWSGEVMDEVERQRRARLAAADLPARHLWRDRRLMALAAQKIRAARDIGV
jgi:L-gulonate 3-dehydrogenase